MDKQKRLKEIIAQIQVLKEEERQLRKELLITGELSFEEQFGIWMDSDTVEYDAWLSNFQEQCPFTYNEMEQNLHRYESYDLIDYFELWDITDPSMTDKEWKWRDKEKIYKIAKEIMEANIGGFKCDW